VSEEDGFDKEGMDVPTGHAEEALEGGNIVRWEEDTMEREREEWCIQRAA
jgi:hypothetical protein